jgi:preprotein translocase subunit SecG
MNILIGLHILITLLLIGTILLQKGESGGLMPSSQGSMFTARGSANFLTKITGIIAALFFGNCIIMTIFSSYHVKKEDVLAKVAAESTPTPKKAAKDTK